MAGHDRRNRSGRIAARLGLPLLLIVASAAGLTPASIEDQGGQSGSTGEGPLILSAERVRHWDEPDSRLVVLEGRASVELDEGRRIRADRILVRFQADDHEPGRARVDIYGEGGVVSSEPGSRPSESLRLAVSTRHGPTLRARSAAGVVGLSGPPNDLPMLARVFDVNAIAEPPSIEDAQDFPDPLSNGEPTDLAGPGPVTPLEPANPGSIDPPPLVDPTVLPTQVFDDGMDGSLGPIGPDLSGIDGEDDLFGDVLAPPDIDLPPTDLEPLPGDLPAPPRPRPSVPDDEGVIPPVFMPNSRVPITIEPRYGGRRPVFESPKRSPDGSMAVLVRGGIVLVSEVDERGRVDLAADSAVIWYRPDPKGAAAVGGVASLDGMPAEVYLEGDVVIRQDELVLAGTDDQRIFKAKRAYVNLQTQRVVALDAEFNYFAPGLASPIRTTGDVIQQYRDLVPLPNGRMGLGPSRVSSDFNSVTGSRFPRPGYRFNARSVDITQVEETLTDPWSGGEVRGPGAGRQRRSTWLVDARQNIWYIGPVPVFYWPRIVTTDDFDPPLRNFSYRWSNIFGHQVLTDWSPFKLFGIEKPPWIDTWNLDIDYLSLRGPALGTEIGWFGRDLIGDLRDPYGRRRLERDVDRPYFGYLDLWGLYDEGRDTLGSGPAVVTYGPPGAGRRGYQRDSVPTFVNWRGRFLTRHMQSLVTPDFDPEDDLRLALEAGAYSDRHFLEQYYKRLWDAGLDQDIQAYLIYQRRNRATTLTAQVQPMDWVTDTQWYPKLEYYRIGDNLLGLFSYSTNSGVNYATVRTAVEVDNPNIFAYIPYDPISNTSGPWTSGRGWTTHQLELPIKLPFVRIVPYVQGQLMGWTEQLDQQSQGRAWGAYGGRLNFQLWRAFNEIDNELLNVHGLAHLVNFNVDYRNAYSSLPLQRIGIQDNYDDDTYEFTRRYFALTNYVGGLLPMQYDPRFLMLRRANSPIVFTPDIQDDMHTVQFHINQRLQTKRGPDGQRRIVDWMILDLNTTYYPQASRDNFGEPFGQNMYNFEWFLGDRTSFVSTGWFEFWEVQGNPILVTDPRKTNDPFGLNVITAGFSLNRPPRGNVYIGYSIINTGTIQTSALNASINYWMSPKWYGSFANSYDFGNAILLSTTFSLTKIGPDFLTSLGISYDPQRNNLTAGFEIAPRFSPNIRLGSAVGTRFDSRFAPTQ